MHLFRKSLILSNWLLCGVTNHTGYPMLTFKTILHGGLGLATDPTPGLLPTGSEGALKVKRTLCGYSWKPLQYNYPNLNTFLLLIFWLQLGYGYDRRTNDVRRSLVVENEINKVKKIVWINLVLMMWSGNIGNHASANCFIQICQ